MEKRLVKRRHLIYFLKVFDETNLEPIGHLVNLNLKGIMLISENEFPQKKFSMHMDLPETIFDTSQVQFEGECLWSKKDVNPDFFVSGFRLTSVSRQASSILKILIDKFGFEDKNFRL